MTPAEIAWVESLVGRPWALGAQGPEVFDCGSLTRLVQRRLFRRDLAPMVLPKGSPPAAMAAALAGHPSRRFWTPVERPSHGCAVEMRSVSSPLHVGTWLELDGGYVLHCAADVGVGLDTLPMLQAFGWGHFVFSDWIGPLCDD